MKSSLFKSSQSKSPWLKSQWLKSQWLKCPATIEKLDQNSFEIVEEIEKILKSIAYEHRFDQFKYGVNNFFIQPWDKVKTAMIHIALHFKQLKQFVKKEVYVDEIIINDFIHRLETLGLFELSDTHILSTESS